MKKTIYLTFLSFCLISGVFAQNNVYKIARTANVSFRNFNTDSDFGYKGIDYGYTGSNWYAIDVRVYWADAYTTGGADDKSLVFGFRVPDPGADNLGNGCQNGNCGKWDFYQEDKATFGTEYKRKRKWDSNSIERLGLVMNSVRRKYNKKQSGLDFAPNYLVDFIIEVETESTDIEDFSPTLKIPFNITLNEEDLVKGKLTQPLDLYVFTGQSNGAGRAPATQSAYEDTFDGIFLHNRTNTFEPANVIRISRFYRTFDNQDDASGHPSFTSDPRNIYNGFNRHSEIAKAANPKSLYSQRLGPSWGFASYLDKNIILNNDTRAIGIVSENRGGALSEQWLSTAPNPTDNLYNPAANIYHVILGKIQAAEAANSNVNLKAIVVTHGESDAANDQGQAFMDNFKSVRNQLMSDLGLSNLPFVFTELATTGIDANLNAKHIAFNSILRQNCANTPGFYFVSSENTHTLPDDGLNSQTDRKVHFDKASMELLGKRIVCVLQHMYDNNGLQLGDGKCSDETSGARLATTTEPEEVLNVGTQFTIYPNPTTSLVHIVLDGEFRKQEVVQVDVIDLSGRTLFREVFSANLETIDLDLSELGVSHGLYHIQISSGERKETSRVIFE